jgi:diacylglycerol O-acyltransferase
MDRLSGLDALFLYGEQGGMHMHVCAVIIIDPSTMPGGYSFDTIKQTFANRMHLVPQFRRRLATIPLGLGLPMWVDDPDFDLDYHMRRIGCPAPCGPEEVAQIAGDIASRPLDRARPLWEFWVIEGLNDGHVAVVGKMHHSTIDGLSGANLMMEVLDLEADPKDRPTHPEPYEPAPIPSEWRRISGAVLDVAMSPVKLAKLVPATVGSVVNFVNTRRGHDRPNSGMVAPFTSPKTSFNAAITPHRNVAFVDVPLQDIKDARKLVEGATVNDVVLAVTAGALRRYLDARGEKYDRALTAAIPVGVMEEAQDSGGSNRVSVMFSTLATDLDDPVERLQRIHNANKGAKAEQKALGATMMMDWADLAAPVMFSLAARLYTSTRLADRMPAAFNLIVSNVPGPPIPLYFCGARLVDLYPLGPILDGLGLNLTVLSNMDHMGFGFIACRELMPDLWELANGVPDALAELGKALNGSSEPTRSQPVKRSPAKKSAAKKAPVRKTSAGKTTARKTTARKTTARKTTKKATGSGRRRT